MSDEKDSDKKVKISAVSNEDNTHFNAEQTNFIPIHTKVLKVPVSTDRIWLSMYPLVIIALTLWVMKKLSTQNPPETLR